MRTTISHQGNRRGGAQSGRGHEQILDDARTILADVSEFLKDRVAVLKDTRTEEVDSQEVKDLERLILEAQKTLRSALDLEAKLATTADHGPVLNLEAARAEIESRLNRLTATSAA
ncbi:MAG: hypothetical protein AB8B85_21355 [Paracoccaceae bacterium]